MARTSGLQSGRILPGMVIVKIYGRQTPSTSYQVAGKLGVPGDSGAWVVGNEDGKACGHVLAWSERKQVAYICPMDVLLRDIGETLNAKSVSFPGGTAVYTALSESTIQPGATLQHKQDLSDLLRDLKIKLPPTPTEIDGIAPEDSDDEKKEWSAGKGKAVPIRVVTKVEEKTRGQLGIGAWGMEVSAQEVDSGVEVDDGAVHP